MAGKYRAYAEYKDSGVEWLGEIPEGWRLVDLRRGIAFLTDFEANGSFADVKNNVDLDSDEKYAWYLRATDLENNRIGVVEGNRTCDRRAYDYLSKTEIFGGEFLVAKRGEIGKVYVVPELDCKATLAPNLYLIRLNEKLSPRYAHYWFSSSYGNPELVLANKSTTIGALYKDDVKACKVLLPRPDDQSKIANFLDHETAKIDTLIEKQQQLIKLLQEKRQAVISHAVTKGLNPNAPMRDSGVEWLGAVPEGWEVKRLKYLIAQPLMYGANEAALDVDLEQPRFIRITDVNDDGTLRDDSFRSLMYELAEPYLLCNGDILFARTGGTVGKSLMYSESWGKCCFAGYLIRARLNQKEVLPDWLNQYTSTKYYWEWIASSQIQATLPNVSADKYNNLFLAIPPLEEQLEILNRLKQIVSQFDVLIDRATIAIGLINERRTALISAAVTGKIDVRDWQGAVESNAVD